MSSRPQMRAQLGGLTGRRLVVGGGRGPGTAGVSWRDEAINIDPARLPDPDKVGDIAAVDLPARRYQEIYFEKLPPAAFTNMRIGALAEAMAALQVGGRLVIVTGRRVAPQVADVLALLSRLGAGEFVLVDRGRWAIFATKVREVGPTELVDIWSEAVRHGRTALTHPVLPNQADRTTQGSAEDPVLLGSSADNIRRLDAVVRHAEARLAQALDVENRAVGAALEETLAGRTAPHASAGQLADELGVRTEVVLRAAESADRLFVTRSGPRRDRLVVALPAGVVMQTRAALPAGEDAYLVRSGDGQRIGLNEATVVIGGSPAADVVVSGAAEPVLALLVRRPDGRALISVAGDDMVRLGRRIVDGLVAIRPGDVVTLAGRRYLLQVDSGGGHRGAVAAGGGYTRAETGLMHTVTFRVESDASASEHPTRPGHGGAAGHTLLALPLSGLDDGGLRLDPNQVVVDAALIGPVTDYEPSLWIELISIYAPAALFVIVVVLYVGMRLDGWWRDRRALPVGRRDPDAPAAGPGVPPVRGPGRINRILMVVRGFLRHGVALGEVPSEVLAVLYDISDDRHLPDEVRGGEPRTAALCRSPASLAVGN